MPRMIITERLSAIRRRLDALRAHDRERVVFGAQRHGDFGHDYALREPLGEEALIAFERDHGVALPPGYRAFIAELGNGGAGPHYGLAPLAPLELDELPQHAVEVRLNDEVVGRSATGPREVPSVASSPSRPFSLADAWSPEDGALPVPEGTSPYDGCVPLADQGCGYFDFLVVNGTQHGEVWSDYTAGDGPIAKAHDDFLGWYEAWLDRAELEWLDKRAAAIALEDVEPHPGVVAYLPRLQAVLEGDAAQWAGGWRALGYAELHLGRPDAALAALERAAEIGTQEPRARLHLDRARVAQRGGRHDEALAAISEGLADPQLWAATRTELQRTRLASLDALGREADALEALQDLAKDAFWTREHHHELARRLLAQEKPEEAIRALEDAIERDVGPNRGRTRATRDDVFDDFIAELEADGAAAFVARLRTALGERQAPPLPS
jgi:tetratricopeptide (TPR) repeat protein